MLAHAMLSTLC